jgi:signal peptidase II
MFRRFLMSFVVVVNLVLLDQVVKALSEAYLKGQSSIVVVENFFNLAYVENKGCAWGMLQGQVWPLAAVAIVMLSLLIWRRKSFFTEGKLGLVTEHLLYAGIIGNLYDRLIRGYVVDMFDFHWVIHHFPVFNIADVFISVAAGLLFIGALLQKDSKKELKEA